jgi:hypothetical protein
MKSFFYNYYSHITAFVFVSFLLFSCDDKADDIRPDLQIPTAYDGSNFTAATTVQRAVLGQLSALSSEMQKGRRGEKVTKETLENLFKAGSPNLEAVSTPYYAGLITGTGAWLDELSKASGGTVYNPGVPQGNGGTLGGYLFDENGLELEQMVEKGLFGAALYNHATTLFSADMTAQEIDQALAVFGATPAFSNSSSNNVASDVRDRFLANYAARRDKNDGNGLYSQIKAGFIKLQAAEKAGQAYQTEKTEAIDEIKLAWEKANAATVINYCHGTINKLSATNPTPDDIGSGLHSYGEAVAFLHGWRTIPQEHKRITDSQIDSILALFNAPHNGVPTSYKFVTDPVNELPKLTQIIDQLKSIYQFSDQEIEDFKKNWVSEQGR